MIVFSLRAVVKSAVLGLKYLFDRVGQECDTFENQVSFSILLGMGSVDVIGKPLRDTPLLLWRSRAPEIL